MLTRLVRSLINDLGGKESAAVLRVTVCEEQGSSGYLPLIVDAGAKVYRLPLMLAASILPTSCVLRATCISGMLKRCLARRTLQRTHARGHERLIQSPSATVPVAPTKSKAMYHFAMGTALSRRP